ncbi:MAG TPA: hypothetical protein VFH91_02890, partial [Pyrinomonadaceae bacterium]|nr:hypothetical protein [Pyrinomonadaceae bacterium]
LCVRATSEIDGNSQRLSEPQDYQLRFEQNAGVPGRAPCEAIVPQDMYINSTDILHKYTSG